MKKPLVVIHSLVCDDGIEEIERPIIESTGAEAVLAETFSEFESLLPELDIMIVANAKINIDILKKAKKCRAVVRHGMGTDNIDIKAATELGVMVCNVPDFNLIEVAEHSLAFALALARRIPQYNWTVKHEKVWRHSCFTPPARVSGMALGIIGFGKIGRLLAKKALPLFGSVLSYDPFMDRSAAEKLGVQVIDSLEDIMKSSDIISLHMPLTEKTFHIIDERMLSLMKPSAGLVNCSRGELVDSAALLKALKEERISGAALDVIENEIAPDMNSEFFQERLLCFTPHVAWYSTDSLVALRTIAAEEARDVILGKIPVGRVNDVNPGEAVKI